MKKLSTTFEVLIYLIVAALLAAFIVSVIIKYNTPTEFTYNSLEENGQLKSVEPFQVTIVSNSVLKYGQTHYVGDLTEYANHWTFVSHDSLYNKREFTISEKSIYMSTESGYSEYYFATKIK